MRLEDMIPAEAQEVLMNSGFTMAKEVISPENCHDLIDLEKELKTIYGDNFTNHIAVKSDGERMDITVAGDEVSLMMTSNGKIEPVLKGVYLKGYQKTAVNKTIVEKGVIVDAYTYNGWETYIVVWNGKLLQVGFHNGEYGLVSYARLYKPKKAEPTPEEYYAVWKDKTKKQSRTVYGKVDTGNEQYGDNAAGLGSVFTQQVMDQLDDITDFVASIADDDQYKQQLDHLRDILYDRDYEMRKLRERITELEAEANA